MRHHRPNICTQILNANHIFSRHTKTHAHSASKHVSVQATWIQTNASPRCFPPALSETHLQQVVQANMLQLCYLIPLYIEKQTPLKRIRSEESIKRKLTTIYSGLHAENVLCSVFKSWRSIANIGYSPTAYHIFRFLLRRIYFSWTFWTNYLTRMSV